MEKGGTDSNPLIIRHESERPVVRSGTIWTAVAHIITAIIGSGVLSLSWSVAQLDWVAGPTVLIIFAIITLIQSSLLADSYRSPDPEYGEIRNHLYIDAVERNLGQTSGLICEIFQQINLFGYGIAYTITSVISLRAIERSNCYHKEGHDAPCEYGDNLYMLIFGAIQIIISQIPNFQNMAWLYIVAAIMSFSYSFIGLGLGLANVIANGTIKGGIRGVPMKTGAEKNMASLFALGDIAFAYPYAIIPLEIQDTLKAPPPENQTMKKASTVSIFITTFFYLCCGCFGYAAFGNETPGNLLTGFGFFEPYWLIDFANACIVLHLIGGYQVYTQPVFSFVDRWFAERYPNNGFINNFYTIKAPFLPPYRLNFLRLFFRTFYVIATTGLAMLFPYFNQVLGLLGALNFWPLAIYFPVEMYFIQRKINPWSRKWIVLRGFSLACLFISMFALVGSIEGVLSEKLG